MDRNAPPWQGFFDHAELSDIGLRRANNQDAFGLHMAGSEGDWIRRGHLFMVADGMGAHAAGELASKMAVDTITLDYFKSPDGLPADAIRSAVSIANAKIHGTGEDNPDFKGMGTTCSALLLLPSGAVAAQVGDSRVYRLRGDRFEQLTRDHSLVWEMMAQRGMNEQEMAGYVPKNIITRSLGPSAEVQIDLEGPFPLAAGDTFLVCSDGLSGQVRDAEMGAILTVLPPAEAVRVLVDLANLRGGPDNITVIVVRVENVDPRWPAQASNHGGGSPGSVHPLTWVAIGVFAMLSAIMYLGGRPELAVGAMGLSLGGVFAALWQRFASGSANGAKQAMPRLGTGPHRTYDCTPSADMLAAFKQLIDPVCQTARQQQWQINWTGFEKFRAAAGVHAAQHDYSTALRDLCRGIIFLMQEVRQQQER